LLNIITFKPATAKFIRIIQTGFDATHPWSIYELQVLQSARAKGPSIADLLLPATLDNVLAPDQPQAKTETTPYE
jgi:hypothetical protein